MVTTRSGKAGVGVAVSCAETAFNERTPRSHTPASANSTRTATFTGAFIDLEVRLSIIAKHV